jgi:hypothetical protein
MTWFFLVLSLTFFLLRDFRFALGVLFSSGAPAVTPAGVGWQPGGWLLGWENQVPNAELGRMASEGDARLKAFAALSLPVEGREEIVRLAEAAAAADPQLTWVLYPLAYRLQREWTAPEMATRVKSDAERLAAFDAENAAPHLLRAEAIRKNAEKEREWTRLRANKSEFYAALAEQGEWQAAMAAAFSKPRYDTYMVRRFELERAVLREHRWAHPALVTASVFQYAIPDLLNLRDYADFRVNHLGATAEQKGRREEALGHYQQVALFGERMHLGGTTLIERMIALAIQKIAYTRLAPALRAGGREAEALRAEAALQQIEQDTKGRREDPLRRTSLYSWSGLVSILAALLVLAFAAATALCVGYVNAKRWMRTEKRGWIYQALTTAENYAALFLFLSCLALYLSFVPYAQNFASYMQAQGPIYDLEPLLLHIHPVAAMFVHTPPLPMENPFAAYVRYALPGIAALVVVGVLARRRGGAARTG